MRRNRNRFKMTDTCFGCPSLIGWIAHHSGSESEAVDGAVQRMDVNLRLDLVYRCR